MTELLGPMIGQDGLRANMAIGSSEGGLTSSMDYFIAMQGFDYSNNSMANPYEQPASGTTQLSLSQHMQMHSSGQVMEEHEVAAMMANIAAAARQRCGTELGGRQAVMAQQEKVWQGGKG